MIQRYRKQILLFAAIANIIAGVMAIAAPAFHFQQLFNYFAWESDLIAHVMMYHIMFWAIVIIMGIGYWMTARTPDENRVMLFVGGAGKLSCALVWLYCFAQGAGNWLMISGTLYDGTFGILFLVLYFSSGKKTK